MKTEIIQLESTDSTNRVAAEYAVAGYPAFTAVIAQDQTAGKGRLGKTWCSAKGQGLYCSILLRPRVELEKLASITLILGLCVAEVLEETTNSAIMVHLKWPNDLFVSGKKIGGILTETQSMSSDGRSCIIAGIGINLHTGQKELKKIVNQAATSLFAETGKAPASLTLLKDILNTLPPMVKRFEQGGLGPFMAEWKRRDYLINKRITVVNTARKIVEGKALGIDESGQMLLMDDLGRRHTVLSGDIRLAK